MAGGGTVGGDAASAAAWGVAGGAGVSTGRGTRVSEGGGEDEGDIAFSDEEMEVAARLFESYDDNQNGALKLTDIPNTPLHPPHSRMPSCVPLIPSCIPLTGVLELAEFASLMQARASDRDRAIDRNRDRDRDGERVRVGARGRRGGGQR